MSSTSISPRRPTASTRAAAAARKRSSSNELASSVDHPDAPPSKLPKVDVDNAGLDSDKENINSINVQSSISDATVLTDSSPQSPVFLSNRAVSPVIGTSPSVIAATDSDADDQESKGEWCRCGNCVNEDGKDYPTCCHDVETGSYQPDSIPSLCTRSDVVALVRDGAADADYDRYKQRIKGADRPRTFAECNNEQKRLILYAVLNALFYGWSGKGARNPMPECIKHLLRTHYPGKTRKE